MTHTQAKNLTTFITAWLRRTMPQAHAIRVVGMAKVQAKDALGWRDVGTLADWIPVARAMGAF